MSKSDLFISNTGFWENLDRLVDKYSYTIDRPKGSRHPRFQKFIYPFDYGFIPFTKSSDGEGLDIWIGNSEIIQVTGILNIVDMDKFDAEMKVLYACTPDEMQLIYELNNQIMMQGVLLIREQVPE